MTRSRALAVIALPIAIGVLMAADDARVRRPRSRSTSRWLSRSGIDLTSLDKTANPCDDFYQFACGGWIKNHPAPPDQPRYGRFDELQERNNAILRDILEKPPSRRRAARAAEGRRLLRELHGGDRDRGQGHGAARRRISLRVAAIKDKAEIPAVVGHMHTVGMSGFFGFGAAPDFKDATQYMLIFGQGGLGLPDRDYYLKDDADAGRSCAPSTSST